MRIVVVGGVAAGLSAASRARRVDPRAEIVVLEKGSRISYGACGLPYLIEGQVKSIDDLTVYTPEFFEQERNIRIRTAAEVVTVRHSARELILRSGERVIYDRLIWAAGARPALRAPHPKLFPFHTDVDALRLKSFLDSRQPRTAAVVGGGYIGLEMAGALRARGLQVSLYDSSNDLLGREDSWLTALLIERLNLARIEVRLGSTVADPAALDADVVLPATGLKPNSEALADAGAGIGRSGALQVSDRMETSLHGVFAAGDCCEVNHLVSGKPVHVPLGTTANKMGRVAGANAAGRRERLEGVVGTSIVRVAGLAVALTGLSEKQAWRDGFSPVAAQIESREKPKYFLGRRLHVQLVADRNTRRLLGGAVVGDQGALARINVIATALTARMRVEDFAELDLAYAPPYSPVMDPLHIVAQQLVKLLD
jgi:NADPH-dependent 2,4-dienoyl-CoA reductase/sulfur reductase-like enzyme